MYQSLCCCPLRNVKPFMGQLRVYWNVDIGRNRTHFGVRVWQGKVRVLLKELPSSGVLTSRTHIIYNLCAYFKMRGLGGKRKKKQQKNREQLSGKLGRPTKSHAYVLRMSNVGPVTQSSVGFPRKPHKNPRNPKKSSTTTSLLLINVNYCCCSTQSSLSL